MTYNEKLAQSEKAIGGIGEELLQAEKNCEYSKKNVNKYKRKAIFKTIILVLLLLVALLTYLKANDDEFKTSITEKLVEVIVGEGEDIGFWLSSVKETMDEAPGQMEELIIMAVSALVCVVLATIGAGGTGLAWGLIGCLLGMGGMVYVFGGTHIIGYLPIPLCIIAVIVKIRDALYWRKFHGKKLAEANEKREKVVAALADKTNEKEKLVADQRKATQIYNDAKANGNDEELLRKAAELGNDEAIAHIEKLDAKRKAEEGEKLYAKATETDEVDEELMERAAELGNPKANLYMGKKLCGEASTGMYTGKEKKDMFVEAVDYLDVAIDAEDVMVSAEAEFWSISCETMYETNTAIQWRAKLERLRALKRKGLPTECNEVFDTLVQSIVTVIDNLDNKPAPREPRLKRKYCAFNNCGVCTYYSTSSYLAKCDYMNNPGDCSAALLHKGLKYEYE